MTKLVTRRARKAHTCATCSAAIAVGDFYTDEQVGIAHSVRHCSSCLPVNPTGRAYSHACPWCASRAIETEPPITAGNRVTLNMDCKSCTRRSVIVTGDNRELYGSQFKSLLADLED